MSRLIETEAFVAVARSGSFTAAAETLEISSSYASKLVSRLEEHLGVRLLHRTTRKLVLTEAGQSFYDECDSALNRIDQAARAAEALSEGPRGQLRISLPTDLGLVWLSRALSNFISEHEDLTVDIVYLDRQVDLLDEGFDLAIRIGELPDSSLIARRILETKRIVIASPAHLERCGAPERPEDLSTCDCLAYSYHRAPRHWRMTNGEQTREVTVKGRVIANSSSALIEACACGLGIAFLPEFRAAEHLRDGRVVRVLEEWSQPVPLHAVYPSASFVPSKVRRLIDHLAEHLREMPWPAS